MDGFRIILRYTHALMLGDMTNFVIGETNICKSAKIDSLNIRANRRNRKILIIISIIYKFFEKKFIVAQVLLSVYGKHY